MKRRALPMFLGAAALFAGVLLVSRLVDLGLVSGAEYGADARRNEVDVTVTVDETVTIRYEATRYPYVRVVAIDAQMRVRSVIPETETTTTTYGRRTAPGGETLRAPRPPGRVLVTMFTPVPNRLSEIEAALRATGIAEPRPAARAMYLPGLRVVEDL